jgi:2,5-dioxopentanoate dehydrogenase
LRATPPEQIAKFLTRFAERIEARKRKSSKPRTPKPRLPKAPRLADVELPRTTGQLRQAAAAALEGSWALPTIDTKLNIRSMLAPIGPVWVFGPNNFPFAFNSVAGGDFAAAIAAGNPVIAKANTSHPGTSRLLAEEAFAAVRETGLPPATVQMIYRTRHEDGSGWPPIRALGAVGYTGSRAAGLKLKAAADAAGKPIYLELSSVNPGGDPARRAGGARRENRRGIHRQLPDGHGAVLHESQADVFCSRATRRSSSSRREGEIGKRAGNRCCPPASRAIWRRA